MRPTFNPAQWQEDPLKLNGYHNPSKQTTKKMTNLNTNDTYQKVLDIIKKIESTGTDIAPEYGDWRNVGFAFADEFGENGRELYHRVSRHYSEYVPKITDLQYTRCLNSKGHGVTIGTFFYWAQRAGITAPSPAPKQTHTLSSNTNLPTLPDAVYANLPELLQQVTAVGQSKEERDILLLGALVSISACLPNIFGIYDGKKVYANLFLFVSAKASAGKGSLVHCKHLVRGIHQKLRKEAKQFRNTYEIELNKLPKNNKKEQNKLEKPPEKMLFIPANTSTTGVFQLLADNEGQGLIFETEGDTLANTFKSDYGNYSDGFRKAFHHESISYYRRMDREYVDIEKPRLSTVLSGTPQQIKTLIPNVENGLFSRFLFYSMPMKTQWKDVFANSAHEGLENHFKQLGKQVEECFFKWRQQPEINFQLTVEQRDQFNRFFKEIQQDYLLLQGMDYMATIRRLGLNAFRMAMTLTLLNNVHVTPLPSPLLCSDKDFHTSLELIRILTKHAAFIFTDIESGNVRKKTQNRKQRYLAQLPETFNRQTYLRVAAELNITGKTADRYIHQFVKSGELHHEAQDCYEKVG